MRERTEDRHVVVEDPPCREDVEPARSEMLADADDLAWRSPSAEDGCVEDEMAERLLDGDPRVELPCADACGIGRQEVGAAVDWYTRGHLEPHQEGDSREDRFAGADE